MGLLDGSIAGLFGEVFGGVYLTGTLVRATLSPDGEGGATVAEQSQACKVQVDAVTEAMRAAGGYTEKDVRLLVLQSGITGGQIDSDCKVTLLQGPYAGITFELKTPINTDPASSYWDCRGTPDNGDS